MEIDYVDHAPRKLKSFDPEIDLSESEALHIAEIFRTPLDGSYNWDYRVADNRIKKLYELGKELNWNGSTDIDWSQNPDVHERSAHDRGATGRDGRRQPVDRLWTVRRLVAQGQGQVHHT